MTHDWAIILAGGDGKRVHDAARPDGPPNQFCAWMTDRTLLQDTRARVALSVDPARTVLVFSAAHREYYEREIAQVPPELVIEQPCNRGTTAAIAFALARIRRVDPHAI